MATLQISDSQLSLLDALWTLFKSLPKAVRSAFVSRIISEESPIAGGSARKAKIIGRGGMLTDDELAEQLK